MNNQKGFTLIELLVVIAVIGILASVILASLNSARNKGADARRQSDMKQIQTALELYYDTYGKYPDPDMQAVCGQWDATDDGVFISALTTNGFLPQIKDPNKNSSCGNYKYYRYPAGSYGCSAQGGAYYVLGVVDMAASSNPHPTSPKWECSLRSWQGEFEWVTGKFERL